VRLTCYDVSSIEFLKCRSNQLRIYFQIISLSADHTPIHSTHHSWVNWQRNSCSQELFIFNLIGSAAFWGRELSELLFILLHSTRLWYLIWIVNEKKYSFILNSYFCYLVKCVQCNVAITTSKCRTSNRTTPKRMELLQFINSWWVRIDDALTIENIFNSFSYSNSKNKI
jgi:hypothetical protein